MASSSVASLFSAASALPAGVGGRQQQRQPRRLVVAAAAKRRYKGTVRREAALAELVERKVAEAMEACAGRRPGAAWRGTRWRR